MGHYFLQGLTSLGNGEAIAYLVVGALLGMIIGVIPGLGGAVVLSIALVFVYHVNLLGTLCLFLGTQAGSYYSASVTSILLNTPAHPEAFAVTLDGFPMAQRGEPGRALGLSAASTCIGGLIGCGVLVGFIQIINDIPGIFHPPEYVALVTLAMILVGTLGTNSVGKAIAAAGAGFMVSSIGPSIITGVSRYTFNSLGLFSGLSLASLALGCFAIPQMVMLFGTGTTVSRQDMMGNDIEIVEGVELTSGFGKQIFGGVRETFRHWVILIQGGLTGALTGIVPGVGGFAANFMSYGIARQISGKKRHLFGTGIPEGIIAPEGASLAKEAGTMIPIIGLGIPGSVGGALFIAALTIKGIRTGVGFTSTYPVLPYQIVWIIALSGILGTVAGVIVGPFLAKVTKVPGPLMVPFIFGLSVFGPYLADVSFFSVMEVLAFGFIGLALRRLRYPLALFILGLVLGPTFESNIYLTRAIYPGISFFYKRPLADGILAVAVLVLAFKVIEMVKEKRAANAKRDEMLQTIEDPDVRAHELRLQQLAAHQYPLLAVITSASLLGTSLFGVVYGIQNYNFSTALMPVIGGILVIIPTAMFLPRDLYMYIQHRKLKSAESVYGDTSLLLASEADEVAVAPDAATFVDSFAPTNLLKFGEISALATSVAAPAQASGVGSLSIKLRSWGRNGEYRREAFAFGWFVGLLILCYVFGFVWGITAFMVAYGATSARRFLESRRAQIIFLVLSTATMWAITYEISNAVHLLFTPQINF